MDQSIELRLEQVEAELAQVKCLYNKPGTTDARKVELVYKEIDLIRLRGDLWREDAQQRRERLRQDACKSMLAVRHAHRAGCCIKYTINTWSRPLSYPRPSAPKRGPMAGMRLSAVVPRNRETRCMKTRACPGPQESPFGTYTYLEATFFTMCYVDIMYTLLIILCLLRLSCYDGPDLGSSDVHVATIVPTQNTLSHHPGQQQSRPTLICHYASTKIL